jgi:hypothetical protein
MYLSEEQLWGGQFTPASGGQFTPAMGGHFALTFGGHFERFLQSRDHIPTSLLTTPMRLLVVVD